MNCKVEVCILRSVLFKLSKLNIKVNYNEVKLNLSTIMRSIKKYSLIKTSEKYNCFISGHYDQLVICITTNLTSTYP